MKHYRLSEVAAFLNVEVMYFNTGQKDVLPITFQGVSSDTRNISDGNLFIALKGERFDAHDYLSEAVKGGAAAFVVEDAGAVLSLPVADRRPYLLVDDSMEALDQVANWYRQKISGNVVGITGSVGKTSTRQMVIAALDYSLKVSGTKANLNNHIGLATTILKADEQTAVIVAEMGIDRPGDMQRLTHMAEPNLAIVTGVGVSHIAQFQTREAILEAKLQIQLGIRDGGYLLLNGDNALLVAYAKKHYSENVLGDSVQRFRVAFVSSDEDKVGDLPGRCFFPRNIRSDMKGSTYDCWEQTAGEEARLWASQVRLPVPGKHQIQNSLFALLVADLLGVRAPAAKEGLLKFEITGNRQRLIEAGGVTIINDSYNASPESMQAALELLSTLGDERKKLLALGGMNELGELDETLHFNLGLDVARIDADHVWLCGPLANHIEKGIHALKPDCPVEVFESRDELASSLIGQLEDNDILLVKASRSFEMEKLVEAVVSERRHLG